jgi:hypothetical protein
MLSLALPVVVPALFAMLVRAGVGIEWFESATVFVVLAIWIGGYAYAAIAIGYLIWMRKKSEREIRRASYLAPPLMLVAFFLEAAIVLARSDGHLSPDAANGFASWGGCILVLGYCYVFAAHGMLFVAKRVRWVAES